MDKLLRPEPRQHLHELTPVPIGSLPQRASRIEVFPLSGSSPTVLRNPRNAPSSVSLAVYFLVPYMSNTTKHRPDPFSSGVIHRGRRISAFPHPPPVGQFHLAVANRLPACRPQREQHVGAPCHIPQLLEDLPQVPGDSIELPPLPKFSAPPFLAAGVFSGKHPGWRPHTRVRDAAPVTSVLVAPRAAPSIRQRRAFRLPTLFSGEPVLFTHQVSFQIHFYSFKLPEKL